MVVSRSGKIDRTLCLANHGAAIKLKKGMNPGVVASKRQHDQQRDPQDVARSTYGYAGAGSTPVASKVPSQDLSCTHLGLSLDLRTSCMTERTMGIVLGRS